MELVYENDYGRSYRLAHTPLPGADYQLVIDSVGIYMSSRELAYMMKVIQSSKEPCDCPECLGKNCNRIWTSGPLVDISLKVDEVGLDKLEDLIKGTQFIAEMDATLERYRIK
jgi:hypothetical protein